MNINTKEKSNKKNFLTGMKIAIDLDDVLGQSVPALIKFHNDTFGTKIKIGDLKTYNLHKIVGGTTEETIKRIHRFHTTHYGKNIKPIKGAEKILKRMKQNNELCIITARSEDLKEETERWVNKYFPDIFSKIYFTNQLLKNSTSTTKKIICANLNIDVLIEDNLEYVLECTSYNRKIYLLDYPWNQTDKLPEGAKRIYSWKEMGELV